MVVCAVVSLRMQTDPRNKAEFPKTSPERWVPYNGIILHTNHATSADIDTRRSFADFIFGSLILQLFCVNYLN